jgi:hypothetical protein
MTEPDSEKPIPPPKFLRAALAGAAAAFLLFVFIAIYEKITHGDKSDFIKSTDLMYLVEPIIISFVFGYLGCNFPRSRFLACIIAIIFLLSGILHSRDFSGFPESGQYFNPDFGLAMLVSFYSFIGHVGYCAGGKVVEGRRVLQFSLFDIFFVFIPFAVLFSSFMYLR